MSENRNAKCVWRVVPGNCALSECRHRFPVKFMSPITDTLQVNWHASPLPLERKIDCVPDLLSSSQGCCHLFQLIERFRSFRANNKYSYPGLFLFLGCGKAILEITLVFAVVWYGLAFLAGSFDPKMNDPLVNVDDVPRASTRLTGFADSLDKVEIPAASVGNSAELRGSQKTLPSDIATNAGVYHADWLGVQESGSYVVQVASSTNKTDLFQKAFEFSDDYPVVVYPFKKTRNNRLMYGVSVGMFRSYNDAFASVDQFKNSNVAEGVWIRSVDEIQKQIGSIR